MEERIISSLSLTSLNNEVLPSECKSDDRSEQSASIDTSSQTDWDVTQDSKTDVSARIFVTTEQAECHSETVFEEPETLTNNTEEEGDLNEQGVHETREETMRTFQTESEDKTSQVERSEPSTVISDLGNDGGGGAKELPIRPEGNSGQMLKVIVPKHLLPAIKQISLPSVLLSRCTSSELVPLK